MKAIPKTLSVGSAGLFQPGLLAQGWLVLDRAGDTESTFRLRRAEITVKGDILPERVSYQVMIDPARVREFDRMTVTDSGGDTVEVEQPATAVSVLQDFYITFKTSKVDVSVGQFKIPVSWEGYNSSSKIILPERAMMSSRFGDRRDIGVRLSKSFKWWGYSAGVFNGSGLDTLDNNLQKDVALRLEAYPLEGLTLAAVTYDSIGTRHRAGTKDRWEADVRYERGPFLLQAELIRARDRAEDNGPMVKAQGAYAAFGYTYAHPALRGALQPVVRVGYVDPDTQRDLDPTMDRSDEVVHYDVGMNYYLKGHEMKLQTSYQRQQFDERTAVNELIFAAQVWY